MTSLTPCALRGRVPGFPPLLGLRTSTTIHVLVGMAGACLSCRAHASHIVFMRHLGALLAGQLHSIGRHCGEAARAPGAAACAVSACQLGPICSIAHGLGTYIVGNRSIHFAFVAAVRVWKILVVAVVLLLRLLSVYWGCWHIQVFRATVILLLGASYLPKHIGLHVGHRAPPHANCCL